MLKSAVDEVEKECYRVIYRIKDLQRLATTDQSEDKWYGSPETAAIRRASMDLTRALAKMRKS